MPVEMKVAGITLDPVTKMPIVILKDSEGNNTLPIWIGIAEASAIATQLENIDLARPMTHDLMKSMLNELGAELDRVEVTCLKDNTFFSSIYLKVGEKNIVVDSRPSDAIALALRTDSPIFVDEEVIRKSKSVAADKVEGEELSSEDRDKWEEVLENLSPEAFGKYKM